MTHRPFTLITAVSLAGLAVFLGIIQSLLSTAPPARALSGDGNGPGYLSADGWWIGAYHFDDGALGFCLNPGKIAPVGLTYTYADPAGMGWWTPEQSAIFAYIARNWAASSDRLTTAAGQLATWMYAGMSDPDARAHAARAGADADAVYARALQMLDEARRQASTGVHAAVVVELAETGPGRVRVELTVDRITGPELLPAGAHSVSVTLNGAAFADGSTTRSVASGTDIPITPTGTEASVAVSASASAAQLPYGDRLTVALPTVDAQAVLIAQPATASADGSADATGPSPLPFQPHVETQTSSAEAKPGDEIADRLSVTVEGGDGLLPTWAVHAVADGFEPVAAVVESTLNGPFAEPIVPADQPPADAPAVCTVETVVSGIGEYTTPPCTLPADGYYVWTERIDPARTDPAEGGARLRPWASRFGAATEITRAETPAAPTTPSPTPTPTAATAQPGPVGQGPIAAVAPAETELAHTGVDVLYPALWSAGAGAAGVALVTVSRLRARRLRRPAHGRRALAPRRARSTWVSR